MLGPASTPVLQGLTTAVYGLVLPETRAMVRRLWSEQPESLFECAYDDRQDAAHHVFIDAWKRWVAPHVSGLSEFSNHYTTNGSSEAIRESVWSLSQAASSAERTPLLHVFAGEYEGYAAYARAAGIQVATHDRSRWQAIQFSERSLHRFYISQPSAIDGNLWPDFPRFVGELTRRGVELAVDLAYVGAVSALPSLDLSAPTIAHVFFSLSKVFGLFYHRVGGVLSRSPMLGLEGNKWFKNMFSLYLGTALIGETASPTTLPVKYQPAQHEACRLVAKQHRIELTPSDVILLASSKAGGYSQAFRRGSGYRWCLTPTMDRLLRDSGEEAPRA
jgi:histidinol-phosphate/aromatic aminotransferase/cobyric acid decarboxylase-like protein